METTNVDMFPLTKPGQEANTAALCKTIGKHLETLEEKLLCYFSLVLVTECLDCVRDPYSSPSVFEKDVTLQGQEELTGTKSRSLFKAKLLLTYLLIGF